MNNETQPITVVFACPRCGTVYRVSQYRSPGAHFGVFNRVSCHAQIYAWSGDYDFLDWQVWASVSRRARRNKSRGPVGRLVAQDSHGDCEERASTRMVPIAKIRISCFVWGSSIVCPTLKGAGGSAPMAPPMEARPACECSVCRPRSRRPGSRGHLSDNPSANRQFRRLHPPARNGPAWVPTRTASSSTVVNAGLARRALRWAVLASIPTSRNASGSSARRVTATSRFAVTSASASAQCSALSLQADLSPPPARL